MSRHAQPLNTITRAAQSSRAASTSTKPASTLPPLRASLILSRQPLLTRTPHPLEAAYFTHQQNVRHALSNPVPENFYFRPGSLPHRRWQEQEWQYVKETYGEVIAGEKPKVGDIEPERPIEEVAQDKWLKEDEGRGERSLERRPEDEVFCVVESKNGEWSFPEVEVKAGEALHDATERITGLDGWFEGRTMDTWLVTKKPIGLVQKGQHRTFYLRSHILAGEPKLSKDSPWKSYAWLSQPEVEERLKTQWDDVKQMFGVAPDKEAVVESTEDAQ